MGGNALCRLGAGEVIGEAAYLHPSRDERSATVVTLEETLFLEINAAALALASEELQERMRSALLACLIDRMREVNRIVAAQGAPCVQSSSSLSSSSGGQALELVPL